jgi:hypothetical protein
VTLGLFFSCPGRPAGRFSPGVGASNKPTVKLERVEVKEAEDRIDNERCADPDGANDSDNASAAREGAICMQQVSDALRRRLNEKCEDQTDQQRR